MDEVSVPVVHVLRPHHVTLLTILMMAFRDMSIKNFPAQYALHLQRVLLNEVSEIAQPKPHAELIAELCSGPQSDDPSCSDFQMAITTIHNNLTTVDKMGGFLSNIPCLFVAKNPDEHPRLIRRSIFGFFCRRCFLTFLKLSFIAVDKLCEDYQAWCNGDTTAGYDIVEHNNISADRLIYKANVDRKYWAKPDEYEKWEKALLTGDENGAIGSLRAFFEQHFHESSDSGFRQHAELNLARIHYINGEYLIARQLLGEAVTAARLANDRLTLHQCQSILHRLPPITPGEKPILYQVQADLHPFDVLSDVSKLLDPENVRVPANVLHIRNSSKVKDQPINAAFHKLFQAISLYDHWVDFQGAIPIDEQQWAQHVVQSVIWKETGCNKLANVEENIVLSFIPSASWESASKLTVTLNKAYNIAREGDYNTALTLLIDPSVWQGLIIRDYGTWALHVWNILTLRATRRGQFRLYRELLIPRRPNGPFNPKEHLFHVKAEKMTTIRESLYQVLQLRQLDQATSGIDHLLRTLWDSEFLCRFTYYRTAIILLADIGLEFGMTRRSKQVLDEIMPQVINGDDLEQRAVASFTLARCIVAAGDSTISALQEAIPHLVRAEADFKKLEMYTSMKDVQYMLSVVYHNLDMPEQRQEAAQRHLETDALQKKMEMVTSEPQILEILELIEIVGSALASR